MLLDNFRKLLGYMNSGTLVKAVDMANASMAHGWISNNNTYISGASTNGTGWGVDVGFSDMAVSGNEYKLIDSNMVDSQLLTFVSGTVAVLTNGIKSITAVYQNNGNDAVVVKEIGAYIKGLTNTYAAPTQRVLFMREVLDTPITVQAGEARSFTCNITFNAS